MPPSKNFASSNRTISTPNNNLQKGLEGSSGDHRGEPLSAVHLKDSNTSSQQQLNSGSSRRQQQQQRTSTDNNNSHFGENEESFHHHSTNPQLQQGGGAGGGGHLSTQSTFEHSTQATSSLAPSLHNLPRSRFVEKEDIDSFGYSHLHSPKKAGGLGVGGGLGFKHVRKESDLFYEQTRKNSMMSNFGGGNTHVNQFSHFN